jgi:hypothetical protein
MEKLAGFPFWSIEFGKDGVALPATDMGTVEKELKDAGVTDLYVMSHGWNNDKADARNLYDRFFTQLRAALDANPAYQSRTYGVLGIFWPSKKFADKELIPGGAAGLSSGPPKTNSKQVTDQLENLKDAFSAADANTRLDTIVTLVGKAESDSGAQREILEHIRQIMRSAITDPTAASQNEDNVSHFLTTDAGELFATLASPPRVAGARAHTAGTGGAASLTSRNVGGAMGISFSGVWDAIKNALNFATYYEMKNRAGVVGRKGVYPALSQLRQDNPTRKMHLIGHSFGARVVTAASDGLDAASSPVRPESICLAQAAFSHYAFAERWDGAHDGLFRSVLTPAKLRGPMLVTHSVHDFPVGVAYAIASRLANQVASAIGDEHDIYGGLGRNGALKCGAVEATLGTTASYQWKPGGATNLNADKIIGGHSDIAKKDLGEAILSAVATT